MFELDWPLLGSHVGNLVIAFMLAAPMAWNREKHGRSAGLRTFPLVAMASCGFMMIAISLSGGNADSTTRALSGVATGIGFIGGGVILQKGNSVRGLATAASLWSTAAIGTAVATHRYEIAVALSVFNTALLVFLPTVKEVVKEQPEDD